MHVTLSMRFQFQFKHAVEKAHLFKYCSWNKNNYSHYRHLKIDNKVHFKNCTFFICASFDLLKERFNPKYQQDMNGLTFDSFILYKSYEASVAKMIWKVYTVNMFSTSGSYHKMVHLEYDLEGSCNWEWSLAKNTK